MLPLPILFEPAFLPDHSLLFDALVRQVAWNESMRARRTACFGQPYNYSGMTYDTTPMHPLLVPIVDRLEGKLGFRPNNCLLNHYEDGRSTMGFHSDSEEELTGGTGVAIVSLGAERAITFRGKQDRNVEHTLALPGGSLLYMPRGLQQGYKHAILAQPEAAGRISLTFRSLRIA
jgi:alkylated DNA repair dioxygenase AlkB